MTLNVFQKMQVVGVEDGSFKKGVTKKTLLAALLFRGLEIDDVKFAKIKVDGLNATEEVVKILNEWKFDAVMLAGVSFGGFNIIDPTALFKKFRKPVIIISRTKPDNKAVKHALQAHFRDWQIRWDVFKKLGPIRKVKVLAKEKPLYIEILGKDAQWANNLIRALTVCGRVPEPLRVARLVARGLS